MTLVLAAFAVLVLARLMPPITLPRFKSHRGFARWDILGNRGYWGPTGWRWAPCVVISWLSRTLFPRQRETSSLSVIPGIRTAHCSPRSPPGVGRLVFVDARGLALKLSRQNVIRFAPGRADGASYNPMLAMRGGAHAWSGARLLAQSFLQSGDEALIDACAVLVLDQMLTAPPELRNFTALRTRLAQPHLVLAEICATWPPRQSSAPAPHCEIARAVQILARTSQRHARSSRQNQRRARAFR